jgi:starvation-inducible DNA-binding protein
MTTTAAVNLPALDEDARQHVGHLLQLTLVELIALALIGKQLHWTITGPGFRELHLHLDELVDEWRNLSDVVAERAAAIGVSPDGRAPTVIGQSDLQPIDPGPTPVPIALRELTARVSLIDSRVRDRCQRLGELDLGSQDVVIEAARTLEKQLWMLRVAL